MVAARKQYALKAVKARQDMLRLMGPNATGKGQGHGQLNDLIILVHIGLQGWEAEDGAAGSITNQGYLRALIEQGKLDGYNVEGWHRAAAGAIDRTGNQVDNVSKWRAALTEMWSSPDASYSGWARTSAKNRRSHCATSCAIVELDALCDESMVQGATQGGRAANDGFERYQTGGIVCATSRRHQRA